MSTMSPLLGYQELASRFNKSTPADVRQYMDEKRIPYETDARGRPWTTITALDKHLGLMLENIKKPEVTVI